MLDPDDKLKDPPLSLDDDPADNDASPPMLDDDETDIVMISPLGSWSLVEEGECRLGSFN